MNLRAFLTDQMLVLFVLLAVGRLVGQVSIKKVSLGSAGVFFVALLAGHLGLTVPKEIMDLGLLLFVYAVGLQAGPRFFRTFARQGRQFVVIASATVLTGGLVTIAVARLLHLPFDLAAGLFSGALTCTPALAGAIDTVERILPGHSATVSVGYGVAYPFSMVGVVLLVQFLPRLFRRNLRQEELAWQTEQQQEQPSLQVRQFLITNPNCAGRAIRDLNMRHMTLANISRVRHGDSVSAAAPDIVLRLHDVVMAVGTCDELDKLRFVLGEETCVPMDVNTNVLSLDAEVTESSLDGKTLAELRVWERYSVVITRIRRQGQELTPTGRSQLEMGDTVRVVGERAAAENFVQLVSRDHNKIDEVNMLPFLLGLVLGVLLGDLPLPLPNGMVIKLGAAGGAFIVSLLVGHFGHIGPLRLHVPAGAKNLARELGLMLFLAGAGTNAGSRLVAVIQQQGWSIFVAGAAITMLSVAVALFLMFRVYRMQALSTMGGLCASMTNPPGLAAANAQTTTDMATLAYASVYPVSLIFKIILAQALVEILRSLRF